MQAIAEEYFNLLNAWRHKLPSKSSLHPLAKVTDKELRALILCPPEQLASCPNHPKIKSDIFPKAYANFFYNCFIDNARTVNIAHWLTKRLKIRVCPYCNRTYTFTVEKVYQNTGKVVRVKPEIDHFYPKSNKNYQHLALSFYNLIPSCPICNHAKKDEIFDYHPYVGNLASVGEPYFEVTLKDGGIFSDNPVAVLNNAPKNADTLALNELYEGHTDYVKELLDKIQAYNHSLYDPLITSFQMEGKTAEYIDQLIWGTYVDATQLDKRPLSKLTHDILRQFDILK